jgi:hypothetical protein
LLNGQSVNELIEKDRHPVGQSMVGRRGFRPAGDHSAALIDQDRAVRLDKLVEHAAP